MNKFIPNGKRSGTPKQIEDYFGIPRGSLANLRYFRKGPRFFKAGRRVLYFLDDVEEWIRKNPNETTETVQ